MGTLQGSLFSHFEECSGTPLTEKQKKLIQILEIVQVEKFVPKTADKQWMGAKAFGSRSHRPILCGQDVLQLSHDVLFDNGITGNSQSAPDLWFCEQG
jgi:hypothetical protein